MSSNQIIGLPKEPEFLRYIKSCEGNWGKISDFQSFTDELFIVLIERGLDDNEFSLLLQFFSKSSLSDTRKEILLKHIVPAMKAPYSAMKQFMSWLISNYRRNIGSKLTASILQWIIGLLDNNLLETAAIDIFYFDFFTMLRYNDLVKFVCKLLCKLTKPKDVTKNLINEVMNRFDVSQSDNKFLFAVLNVFQGYKPYLILEPIKRVDIDKVMKSTPQKMDKMMKVTNRRIQKHSSIRDLGVITIPARNQLRLQPSQHVICSLIPHPRYDLQRADVSGACQPKSIQETFKNFGDVAIPQNIISLLRDEAGFFMIAFKEVDLQIRFSDLLLRTLQDVLIYQAKPASEDDKEFLLSRVHQLEMFMEQGIPCVSLFLSGYLLNWDGLDHRSRILSLIEWATFDSFQDLATNLLRPLYILFVSYDVTMKCQIIRVCTHLIKNMMIADVERRNKGLPHPFLKKAPAWTNEPLTMLEPLIKWTEKLIKLGMCTVPGNSVLLMECVRFYETMNVVEAESELPLWTIVSEGVVFHSLFNVAPIALNRVCRLLLRYHKVFLPKLRISQPQFYDSRREQINLTSKYAQELINSLWSGQAFSRKEDGVMFKKIPEELLQNFNSAIDLDVAFDLSHNVNFVPFAMVLRGQNGPMSLRNKDDFLTMLEYYVEDIAEFIKYFSPAIPTDIPLSNDEEFSSVIDG